MGNNLKRDILTRSVTNIIPSKEKLSNLLSSEKKLKIYMGIDPTATKIHLGHAVALKKLQNFVEMGHEVIFLIGDFTALIGDTSDKEGERPVLTYMDIKNNFKDYKRQASKILDFSKVKVVYNSKWLKKLGFEDVVSLCQNFSIGDFISRELIKKRLSGGKRVGLHEILYPVMQGYDSMHLNADVQIGGADQTFNMQAGRTLQKNLKSRESFVLVVNYLPGTDNKKMSKTWGNAVWLEDSPNEMFGKIMSLSDNLIEQYLTLATKLSTDEIYKKVKRAKKSPLEVKKELAFQVVLELHSKSDARQAKEVFEKTFQKKSPGYSESIKGEKDLASTITQKLKSKSEAKRLISQGAVYVNENRTGDPTLQVKTGDKIKVGTKIFLKVR